MDYIKNNLLTHEKVIYSTRPHWIIFFASACYLLATILVYIIGPQLRPFNYILFGYRLYQLLGIACLLLTAYTGIGAYITYTTSEYGITDKRILMKQGWIRRNSLELFLDKIEAIRVYQSIPGRILNYGSLLIIGTGGSEDPFMNIPDPLRFRKRAQQEIDELEHPN